MSDTINVLRLGIGGMKSATDPSLLDDLSFAFGVNTSLKDGRICTRPGFVALQAAEDDEGFRSLNFQGATYYNPALGDSALSFANDNSTIMLSAGGRKFRVKPVGSGKMIVENVSGGLVGKDSVHLCYLYQAESYLIAQDGMGPTWIYQPTAPPVLSKGYNYTDKEASELANGATVGGYVHGRVFQVVNGNQIVVGDIIHKDELTSPSNILKTTEQVYWATGAQFSPPSSMGAVVAAFVLPLQDTTHGHEGSLFLACESGTFSLDLSRYPRTSWSNLPLTRHALIGPSARGFYAVAPTDSDAFFRSRQGLHSFRSSAAPPRQLGNPQRPVSESVNNLFRTDRDEFLRFASVESLAREDRLFCTLGHRVSGSYRWAESIASLNFTPLDGQSGSSAAWDGLWTTPPRIGKVIQMVSGIFNGRERCYAITRDCNNRNQVVEVNAPSECDILEDGTRQKIACKLITRAIVSPRDPMATLTIVKGTVFLSGIQSHVKVRISYRNEANGEWKLANEEEIGRDPEDCMVPPRPMPYGMKMKLSGEAGRYFQFMVEWIGYLEVRGVRVKISDADPDSGEDDGPPVPEEKNLCLDFMPGILATAYTEESCNGGCS